MSQPAFNPDEYNPEPGSLPQFGPPFVRFTHNRFAKLEAALARLGDRLRPRDEPFRTVLTCQLDASGNGTASYEAPMGFDLFVHRLYINDNVSNFGTPTTGGYLTVEVSNQVVDGVSLATVGLPAVYTASSSAAIVVPGGELLQVKAYGLTASRSLHVVVSARRIRGQGDEP